MKLHWRIPQKVYLAIILAGLIAIPWFQLQGAGGTSSSLRLYSSDETALDITTNQWYVDAIKTTTGNSWFGGHIRVGKDAENPNYEDGILYYEKITNPAVHRRGILSTLYVAQTTGVAPYTMVGGEFQAYILPTNTKNWTGGIRGSDSEIFTMAGSTGNIAGAYAVFSGATVKGASIGKLYGLFYGEVTITAPVAEQYGLYIAPLTSALKNYAIFTNAGNIHLGGLPTSDPGIAGDLWSDNGALKVSSGLP